MGWDVWLADEAGDTTEKVGSLSFNMNPIYLQAFRATGHTGGLRTLEGMRADAATQVAEAVLSHLSDPAAYENDDEDCERAASFLRQLRDACLSYPNSTVVIW